MSTIRRWGEPPRNLAPILDGVEFIPVSLEDEHEREHVEFVRNHPAFPKALKGLQRDLEVLGTGVELSSHLIDAAIADPESRVNYFAREFAKDWGLTPAVAYYLALKNPASVDTEHLAIGVTPLEYVLHVPRPLTPARRRAILDWLKSEQEPGSAEEIWGKAGKRRWDASPRALEAIPWFQRWNEYEEPAQIYRDVSKEQQIDFETFHSSLVSAWERMKTISPREVREERPSKASA